VEEATNSESGGSAPDPTKSPKHWGGYGRDVSTPTQPSPRAPTAVGPTPSDPHLDHEGRYHARGRVSYAVVGTYVVMMLIVLLVLPSSVVISIRWVPYALAAFLLVALVRYLSTSYRIDDLQLRAWRIFGGRRVELEQVRRIEFASLRDLSPTGFFGAWGWRGRMWSPLIGRFDSIHTEATGGLLITAGDVPVYISPRDPEGFARELSRRVRSYTGRLAYDVGDPMGPSASLRS
jgi:hypothetical protein